VVQGGETSSSTSTELPSDEQQRIDKAYSRIMQDEHSELVFFIYILLAKFSLLSSANPQVQTFIQVRGHL